MQARIYAKKGTTIEELIKKITKGEDEDGEFLHFTELDQVMTYPDLKEKEKK